jgi:hypothetical protein
VQGALYNGLCSGLAELEAGGQRQEAEHVADFTYGEQAGSKLRSLGIVLIEAELERVSRL